MRNNYFNIVSVPDPIKIYAFDVGMWDPIYILIAFNTVYKFLAFSMLVSLKLKLQ